MFIVTLKLELMLLRMRRAIKKVKESLKTRVPEVINILLDGKYVDYCPISTITDGAPIEFLKFLHRRDDYIVR